MLKRLLLLVTALLVGAGWIAAGLLWLGVQLVAPAPANVGPPPADVGAEPVEFLGAELARLSGWWIPGQPGHGTVVLLHRVDADRRAMLPRARLLSARGLAVLLYDQRAHGESAGQRVTFGRLEAEDAVAAIALAIERSAGERVGALGIGLGGEALVHATVPGQLDAVVIESAPPTLRAALRARMRSRIGPLTHLALPWVASRVVPALGLPSEPLVTHFGAARFGRPTLIVGAENNPDHSAADLQAIFDAARPPKELWIAPRVGAGDLFESDPNAYSENVLDFLVRNLAAPPVLDTGSADTPALDLPSEPAPFPDELQEPSAVD